MDERCAHRRRGALRIAGAGRRPDRPPRHQRSGYGFVPENFNAYVVDNVVAVNTTDAQRAAQKVLRTDAIPASVASGAILQAAAQLIHVGVSRSALAILPGRQIVNTL